MVETANNDGSVTIQIEDFTLTFKHNPHTQTTSYKIIDSFEGTTDEVTVPTENFNLALRAFKDEKLTEAEYELAEAALGPNVRWIP